MWIALGIIAFLALLITVILLLPVRVLIWTDEAGELQLRYKILFKTFGENPNPNDPIVRALKRTAGLDRLEKKGVRQQVQQSGLSNTALQLCRIVLDLLLEIVSLLNHCTAKRFAVRVRCSGEDAAETAIAYGRYCAVLYPLRGYLGGVMKLRPRGEHIEISCDYNGGDEEFSLDLMLSVRLFRVVAAFFRVAFKEAERTADEQVASEQITRRKTR